MLSLSRSGFSVLDRCELDVGGSAGLIKSFVNRLRPFINFYLAASIYKRCMLFFSSFFISESRRINSGL